MNQWIIADTLIIYRLLLNKEVGKDKLDNIEKQSLKTSYWPGRSQIVQHRINQGEIDVYIVRVNLLVFKTCRFNISFWFVGKSQPMNG